MITAAGEAWLAEYDADVIAEWKAALVRLDDLTADAHHTAEDRAALRQAITATEGGAAWLAHHDRGVVEWYNADMREPGEPELVVYAQVVGSAEARA